jgi:hypothetical protein
MLDDNVAKRRQWLGVLGSATITSLAGCSDPRSQSFESKPVGLPKDEIVANGFSRARLEPVTVSSSELDIPVGDLANIQVTSHVSIYNVEPSEENVESAGDKRTANWDVVDDRSRALAILSTPAIEIGRKQLNPLSSESLSEILNGKRGKKLLQETAIFGETPFEWTDSPEPVGSKSVTLLDKETTLKSYFGQVQSGDSSALKSVLIHLARVVVDGNVVIAGMTQWRQGNREAPDSPPSSSPSKDRLATLQKNGDSIISSLIFNGAFNVPLSTPMVSLRNGRLVQKSMDTRVVDQIPGPTKVIHDEPDPPLVVDDQTGVLFDWTATGLDNLPRRADDFDVDIVIWDTDGNLWSAFSFSLSPDDIEYFSLNKNSIARLFSGLTADPYQYADIETFKLTQNIGKINVSMSSPDAIGDTITLQNGPDFDPERLRPLRIGFVEVVDPDSGKNYGGANGRVDKYRSTVANTVEYMERVFPGKMVAYRMDRPLRGARDISKYAETITYTKAQAELNRTAFWVHRSLQQEGTILRSAPDKKTGIGVLQREGFDVVVAVLPDGYYAYHNAGNLLGFAPSHITQCVSMLGQSKSGNRRAEGVVKTGAQEAVHRLIPANPYQNPRTCHPMGQRDDEEFSTRVKGSNCKNEPVDFEHSRHYNTSFTRVIDKQAVVSVPLDFTDGKFSVVGEFWEHSNGDLVFDQQDSGRKANLMESYMSYTDKNAWADSRITRRLVESGFDVNSGRVGGAGKRNDTDTAQPVITIAGGVGEDGTVSIDYLLPYDGTPISQGAPAENDSGATITFHDPGGETLQTTTVPTRDQATHRDPIEGVLSARLELPKRAISLRVGSEGTQTELNVVVDPLLFAIERVHNDRITPGTIADLRNEIEETRSFINEDSFNNAIRILRTRVRPLLIDEIDSDSTYLAEPSRDDLETLLTRGIERLSTVKSAENVQ